MNQFTPAGTPNLDWLLVLPMGAISLTGSPSTRDVAAGLIKILGDLGDKDRRKISNHLGGPAYDIAPNPADLSVVMLLDRHPAGPAR
jgi:hypothetical protein